MNPVHPTDDEQLFEAFNLSENRYIFIIGGGGKTTLMFRLAHLLADKRYRVLTTTSTKIVRPTKTESSRVLVETSLPSLLQKTPESQVRHTTIAKSHLGAKLSGFSADELDTIRHAGATDYLIVEADGSAGRSLKAHQAGEPVVSTTADLVIVVIGVDCVGKPLNEATVHRAALFSRLLSLAPQTPITCRDVARIVLHPKGYLQRVGTETRVICYLSKVRTDNDRGTARRLSEDLQRLDEQRRISRVVVDAIGNV